MALSTTWMALVVAAGLVLLGCGIREALSRGDTGNRSDRDDRHGADGSRRHSGEVSG